MGKARSNAVEHSHRGRPRRTSRTARCDRPPEHVVGPLADDVHVGLARIHVGARAVDTAQRGDEIAVTQEECAALLPVGDLPDCDHRLAAAERQPRNRELPRHRSRKAHCVLEALGRFAVRLHPGTAASRTAARRMEADEDPRAAFPIQVDERRLAVPRLEQLLERHHDPIRSQVTMPNEVAGSARRRPRPRSAPLPRSASTRRTARRS